MDRLFQTMQCTPYGTESATEYSPCRSMAVRTGQVFLTLHAVTASKATCYGLHGLWRAMPLQCLALVAAYYARNKLDAGIPLPSSVG
jgi:hypothetical protein